MMKTYIIRNSTKPLLIIKLDDRIDVIEQEYENYHGRFNTFLKLTKSGLTKVEDALGYQPYNNDFSVDELTETMLNQKIKYVDEEIKVLELLKKTYYSWLDKSNNLTHSKL